MLRNKDIAKIQEIKTLFTDSWIQPEFFSKQIELFNFTKASKILKAIKKSGVPVWDIIKLLLILPFSNAHSIHSLYSTKMAPEVKGQKERHYSSEVQKDQPMKDICGLYSDRKLVYNNYITWQIYGNQ